MSYGQHYGYNDHSKAGHRILYGDGTMCPTTMSFRVTNNGSTLQGLGRLGGGSTLSGLLSTTRSSSSGAEGMGSFRESFADHVVDDDFGSMPPASSWSSSRGGTGAEGQEEVSSRGM